jgi:hypothetical protein
MTTTTTIASCITSLTPCISAYANPESYSYHAKKAVELYEQLFAARPGVTYSPEVLKAQEALLDEAKKSLAKAVKDWADEDDDAVMEPLNGPSPSTEPPNEPINRSVNGPIYGSINGTFSSTFNGRFYGIFNGTTNGTYSEPPEPHRKSYDLHNSAFSAT